MRRLLIVCVGVLATLVAAAPALAATDTYRFTMSGSWASATFSNIPWEAEELPPGDYFYTDIWASEALYTGDGTFEENGVCVSHESFTVDDQGEWTSEDWFDACVDGADLTVSSRLTSASLSASLPIVECVYDEQTDECIDIIDRGTVELALDLIGVGPVAHGHGTDSGGTAGFEQYVSHGTYVTRDAVATGSVELVSPAGEVTDLTGGQDGDGWLQSSRNGSTEVLITRPGQ